MDQNKIEELRLKKEKAKLGGGPGAIEKKHARGHYTARERIERLLDPDSFVELDMLIKHRCVEFDLADKEIPLDGIIIGYGTIMSRKVCVFSQDSTVLGGSLGETHANKMAKIQQMALKTGCPIIGINDSAGGRIHEGVDAQYGYGKVFYLNSISSGVIPQLSLILGNCVGGATYSPALTDFIFTVAGVSKMFITGPEVIKAVNREEVTAEQLGDAMVHNSISGNAQFYSESEDECFEQVRYLLSFLPQNNKEKAPSKPARFDYEMSPEVNLIVPDNPNKAYDIKSLIHLLSDDGEFFEYQPYYAENIVTGFIRINGSSVGVVANQPCRLAGCIDINASDKSAKFIRTCDAFNIPLLTLADVPGFMPGTAQEYGGIIRHGAKMLYAYSEATVPKVTVVIRKGYGGAYVAMCDKTLGCDLSFAWPTAEIAVVGPAAAAGTVFRKEIAAAEDKDARKKELIESYTRTYATPYLAAGRGYIDDVIEPYQTRAAVIRAFEMLKSKEETRPVKKHGLMPV